VTDIRGGDARLYLALGRVQAYSRVRGDCAAQLALALRGAYELGASIDELHVESGLDAKTLRAIVRGGGLKDAATPGFARTAASSRVATPGKAVS